MKTDPAPRSAEDSADALSLDGLIGYNLKRAYVVVREDFRRAMEDEGLSPRAFSALSIIAEYPNISQSEVARMLGVDRSGMVAITDDLERRAYLRRTASARDRRVQALMPTAAGQAAHARALRKIGEHEARLFAGFTPDEQATLIALLRRIRDGRSEPEG